MDLCFSCQRFNIHSLCQSPGGWGTYQLKLAREGAQAGCSFCRILLDGVLENVPTEGRDNLDGENLRIFLQATRSRTSSSNLASQMKGLQIDGLSAFLASASYKMDGEKPLKGSDATFRICAEKGSYAATTRAIAGRSLGRDPRSPSFLQGLQEWLATCLQHPRCCQTLSGVEKLDPYNAMLPTRCINVTGERLLLEETSKITGSYLTLSHRWTEEAESSQTTRLNVQERQDAGFEVGGLPKAFQDAIWLAQQLSIPYLWIDSICIIQGHESTDWAAEAGKMAGYYQASLFTIAAAHSEGLFPSPTPPFGRRLARVPFFDRAKGGKQRGYFYVYPSRPLDTDYDADVRNGILLRRGWVFQEWLLSRRLVTFAPTGIYFDCQSEFTKNSLGDRLGIPKDPSQYAFLIKPLVKLDRQERLEDSWFDIVEAFSALELTFPQKDRLLALSGIATEFSAAIGSLRPVFDPFICGLWLQDMYRGLLWQARRKYNKHARMDSWIPSWSWASLLAPVSFSFMKRPQTIAVACEIQTFTTRNGAVYPSPIWRGKESSQSSDIASHYPITAEYTNLYIECSLCLVTVLDLFTEKGSASLSVPVPEGPLRKISLGNDGARDICGWACFDDSDFQDQRAFWDGQDTFALHVLTSKPKNGWLEQGLLWGWEPLYMVIFVRRVEDETYRRIGMGGLWGSAAKKRFSSSLRSTIRFV
ncbi:heterokaryon incompatibility protein-domain-containing protein [Immersiella caudata]|uniref:Heterokaryon incompatibility protein-domain-containing protein n=1 Tax=Immersiella caudata TaxID=314043 RepID=A0AA39WZ17_9PEZI|nr:heterokaryon incompatibility protein-domain-containing protein [Immersiella caudata]